MCRQALSLVLPLCKTLRRLSLADNPELDAAAVEPRLEPCS